MTSLEDVYVLPYHGVNIPLELGLYLTGCLSIHTFFRYIISTIELDDLHVPKLQQKSDSYIMEHVFIY